MKSEYVEMERPVLDLEQSVSALREHARENGIDISAGMADLESSIAALKEDFRRNVSPWQKVLMARDTRRPQPQDFIHMIFTDFFELHGDRRFGDDPTILGGFAMLDKEPVMVIATRKGHDTSEYMATHFGCAEPEGYRKALRLMQLAEKAGRPVITLIDTPGAYPGISGGERHIGEAIACNLRDMFRLTVPVISVITGEGGSGGALGLAVGNRVLILENAYYSVITPEGCAAILWRTPEKVAEAASALKLTAPELLKLGVVDEIVPEALSGAHSDPQKTAENLKIALCKNLSKQLKYSRRRLKENRYRRFRALGIFNET